MKYLYGIREPPAETILRDQGERKIERELEIERQQELIQKEMEKRKAREAEYAKKKSMDTVD